MSVTKYPVAGRQRVDNLAIWALATAIATGLCVLIAPFGTSAMPIMERALFWAFWNSFAAVLMFGLCHLVLLLNVRGNVWQSLICSALFASLYAPLWPRINAAVFARSAPPASQIWLNVFLIALAIFAIVYIASPAPKPAPTPSRPRLYTRLEKYPNARILALRAQDHYVEVITNQGRELLRMRFSDAQNELAPLEGIQTHRSYWVAREAIRKFDRKSLTLELQDGESVPVSKRRVHSLRGYLQNPIHNLPST